MRSSWAELLPVHKNLCLKLRSRAELSSFTCHCLLLARTFASASTDLISYIGSAWNWLNARYTALKFYLRFSSCCVFLLYFLWTNSNTRLESLRALVSFQNVNSAPWLAFGHLFRRKPVNIEYRNRGFEIARNIVWFHHAVEFAAAQSPQIGILQNLQKLPILINESFKIQLEKRVHVYLVANIC